MLARTLRPMVRRDSEACIPIGERLAIDKNSARRGSPGGAHQSLGR